MGEFSKSILEWRHDPKLLKLWEGTHTKCGEWSAVKVPGGVIYTQWRCITRVNDNNVQVRDWEPFFSVLG